MSRNNLLMKFDLKANQQNNPSRKATITGWLFILWLLINLLLAIKSFGFAPVDDQTALKSLLWSVFSTVCFVPYIKYAKRVRETFTQVR